jgi:hypothetical protein
VIKVYFSEKGYYVAGESVEVARKCSPATTERGDRIFQSIHHCYKILALALQDVNKRNVNEDVMVMSDSRIIDEINGTIEPLDEVCKQFVQELRRKVIPSMGSLVFFRKKSPEYINDAISRAHARLIIELSEEDKRKIVSFEKANSQNRKKRLVNRLKDRWYGK